MTAFYIDLISRSNILNKSS